MLGGLHGDDDWRGTKVCMRMNHVFVRSTEATYVVATRSLHHLETSLQVAPVGVGLEVSIL